MINRVLDLQHLKIGQITVTIENACAVTVDTPMGEILKLSRERNLTRFPVWQGKSAQRRIVGIVSLKTLLYDTSLDPNRSASHFVKPALYLRAEMPLDVALGRIQRSGNRLAVVLDRDQRELGIVSLQDILKVIFGEVSI